jgi:hypothetical protein
MNTALRSYPARMLRIKRATSTATKKIYTRKWANINVKGHVPEVVDVFDGLGPDGLHLGNGEC